MHAAYPVSTTLNTQHDPAHVLGPLVAPVRSDDVANGTGRRQRGAAVAAQRRHEIISRLWEWSWRRGAGS
jgi:hypothetical protein